MHQSWPARTSQDEDQSSGIWDREARQWAQKPDADSENDPLIVLMRQKGALAPEHSFLDVGCGPGRYSVVLAREAKFVVGCDSSAESCFLSIECKIIPHSEYEGLRISWEIVEYELGSAFSIIRNAGF